ncbi:M23 family metallopeptidase [Varunaivibrio sulfuroxidans]|uniref:Murein DD-endopeptidase MepM/ murein hydrolase activator NlpD n=1 Tax=Varunaivibrio sulfuroxidans TaxID=1773489 RepID=A0A4R3J8Q7_9PROT|nr:M23 family metallopeptidase [Varunaivibrio sulfuroxidans]TCS61316.1 murein DD-endopeptidase MepM/ murein hydrolase activator NlpD [Varunaivibrio sulfuroxidans]WES31070.1 M23 family metallopeptidase [Varunaivibrio sulfuroxidans]
MVKAHLSYHNERGANAWRALAVVFLFSGLAACGSIEWPSSGNGPYLSNQAGRLSAGDTLFINASRVKVAAGDTLYAISRRHNVSPRALIVANHLSPPYNLSVGQWLTLPHTRVHVVARGDYLYAIARRYHVDFYALARANGVRPPYTIYPGQKLRLPSLGLTQGAETGNVTGTRSTSNAPEAGPRKANAPLTSTRSRVEIKAPSAARRHPLTPVPRPGAQSAQGFTWPVHGKIISHFGAKDKGLYNDGINIAVPRGTAIHVAENGVVVYAGNELRGFGNLLLVKHAGGWMTAYAHNQRLLVKRGDKVVQGQVIARAGSTGTVKTSQLHFELRKGKRAVDPEKYLGGA